jgi:hypothetical protein
MKNMLEFKIYTKDITGAVDVLKEFINIANKEIEKSKALKVWGKVSGKIGLPPPTFLFSYRVNNGYVSFYVNSTYKMPMIRNTRMKLLRNVDGALKTKGIKVESIVLAE